MKDYEDRLGNGSIRRDATRGAMVICPVPFRPLAPRTRPRTWRGRWERGTRNEPRARASRRAPLLYILFFLFIHYSHRSILCQSCTIEVRR